MMEKTRKNLKIFKKGALVFVAIFVVIFAFFGLTRAGAFSITSTIAGKRNIPNPTVGGIRFTGMQSLVSDGTYVYVYKVESGVAQGSERGIIIKMDMAGNVVQTSGLLSGFGHGNSATFDTKNNRIVMGNMTTKEVGFIDPNSLTRVGGIIYTNTNWGAICYNSAKNTYLIGGGENYYEYDENFTRGKLIISDGRAPTGMDDQGSACDSHYIYLIKSYAGSGNASQNRVWIYNWFGEKIGEVMVGTETGRGIEMENGFMQGTKLWVGFNGFDGLSDGFGSIANFPALDRTAPTFSVRYSSTSPTNQNVVVSITTNEAATTTSAGWAQVNSTGIQKTYANNVDGAIWVCDHQNYCAKVPIKITNIDKIKPVITLNSADVNPQYVEVNTKFTALGATTNEGTLSATNNVKNTALGSNYKITYTATDAAGNKTAATRAVVVRDTTDPTLTVSPLAVQIAAGANYDLMTGVSVRDNYNAAADIKIAYSSVPAFNSKTPGQYKITYRATDTSGNVSATKIRTITVKDSVLPVISLRGPASMTVEAGGTFQDPFATATDAISGGLKVSSDASATNPNMKVPEQYKITYRACDSAQNCATKTRLVMVVDTKPPVITLKGNNPIYVQKGEKYSEAGATATDIISGAITPTISGTVNSGVVGNYTITYVATDEAGNKATATRTVIVRDTIAPRSTVSYSTTAATNDDVVATITTDSAAATPSGWTKISATKFQKTFSANISTTAQICDDAPTPNCSSAVIKIANIDKTPPSATVAYSTTDPTKGRVVATITTNSAATTPSGWTKISTTKFSKSFTTNINQNVQICDSLGNCAPTNVEISNIDTAKPVITINGANPQRVPVKTAFTDLGATAKDAADSSVKVDVKSKNVDADKIGNYSVVYVATDDAGNSVEKTRAVVVFDGVKPVVSVGAATQTFKQNQTVDLLAGVSASDNYDGKISEISPTSEPEFDNSKIGSYKITYTAKDSSGNRGIATRIINITDGILPNVNVKNSTEKPTNQSVKITISANENISAPDKTWKKIDEKTYEKTFDENINQNLQICDLNSNCQKVQISVENIDKIPPKLEISYSTSEKTRENVVATISSDKKLAQIPTGWTEVAENIYQKTFVENASEVAEFFDEAGNSAKIIADVNWIEIPANSAVAPNSSGENPAGAPAGGAISLLRNPFVFAILGIFAAMVFLKFTQFRARKNARKP